jgi:hypothetical protein
MDGLAALVVRPGLAFPCGARRAFCAAIAKFSGDTAEKGRSFARSAALALASLVAITGDKLGTTSSLPVTDRLPGISWPCRALARCLAMCGTAFVVQVKRDLRSCYPKQGEWDEASSV